MQLAKRERTVTWGRHAGAALALALLLAFLGPFSTQEAFDRPTRYAFWLGLVFFGYACTLAAFVLVDSTPQRPSLPVRVGLGAVISAIPQTLAVAWTFTLLQPERRIGPADLLPLFGAVLAIQLILAIAASALTRPAPAPTPAAKRATPRFLDKLPPHMTGQLIALEAQDHYMKVHTRHGAHLLLMRLSDAAAELSDEDGLQVHRGWWVARDAVSRVETQSGRTILRLSNGLIVPVSRTYLQAVRSSGWGTGA